MGVSNQTEEREELEDVVLEIWERGRSSRPRSADEGKGSFSKVPLLKW